MSHSLKISASLESVVVVPTNTVATIYGAKHNIGVITSWGFILTFHKAKNKHALITNNDAMILLMWHHNNNNNNNITGGLFW